MWGELGTRRAQQSGGRPERADGQRAVRQCRKTHLLRRVAPGAILLSILLGALFAQPAGATLTAAAAKRFGYSLTPSKTTPYTPCPPGGKMIECNLVIDPPSVETAAGFKLPDGPLLEGSGEGGGYDASNLRSAYGIPATGGSGETVAVIDAYGYTTAEADLAKYREYNGLEACTKASGCFKIVNEKGEEKNYPKEAEGELGASWKLESALDLDMVSAVCSHCHIMLVEATTQEAKDTAASAEEAAKLGATEISNSYGYPENNETYCPGKKGCKEYLSDYDHTGVPVTVSSGDSGYDDGVGAPSWPATSPNVIAVGGTSLTLSKNSRGWAESVWSGSGSGCSLYESKPAWQKDKGCTKRTDNDVAAVANPETPVSIYQGEWVLLGGTSVASPLIAGMEAHANSATKSAAAEAFYKKPGMLFDVLAGSNGTCTPPEEDAYLCTGEAGYDGPTGMGAPNGAPHLSGWYAQGIPNLAVDVKHSSLAGVSCAYAEECMSAGGTIGAAGTETTLVEHLEGGKDWVIKETPEQSDSTFADVSCDQGSLGAKECFAVGHYVNSSSVEAAAIDRWTDGTWTAQTVPTPKEAKSSTLTGVSCYYNEVEDLLGPSCTAVGHYVSSTGVETAFAEHWEGTGWYVQEMLLPEKAKSSSLTGVSCVYVKEEESVICLAVGHYVSSTGTELPLTQRYVFKEWLPTGAPVVPKEAKSTSMSGVSCLLAEPFDCTAVGHYVTSTGTEETLAESWVIRKPWAILETPNPKEAKSSSLSRVSCTTPEACTATGQSVNSSGTEVPLAERLSVKTWSIQETVNPTGAKGASLPGVACTGAEVCYAAGRYVNSSGMEVPLAESWNGKAWSTQETQTPKETNGSLPGVWCTGSEACTAVGHYLNSSGTEVTLAESSKGSEWSREETVTPTGAKSSSLASVSCSAAEACTAVGHYVNSSSVEVTLAERWNGKEWVIQSTVTPTGAKSSSLASVSCSAAAACMAVGHFVNSSGVEVTLSESWNGTSWSLKEPPNPTGAKGSSLGGVSCTTSEACTAVGRYVNSSSVEGTLAESWNGKEWSIQETSNPEAKSSALVGVSCTSSTACMASGHSIALSGTEVALVAEHS
jgi:hypothetical protein